MKVSIVIAVKGYCENLKESVSRCLELDYRDYEIIILPDKAFPKEGIFSADNIKIIATGDLTPPYKRDIGVTQSKGEIIAFLDDDAYPVKGWLKEAVKIFRENKKIGCVCGPAPTAPGDSLRQVASGCVYSSFLVSGNHNLRYVPGEKKEVFDIPSCNLLIKKSLFEEVSGFGKAYWPGEDTFLCLKVLEEGSKMVYDPKVLVYHHRRSLFGAHLKQIKNYALHRGYFVKKYPKTSFKLEYFVPSVFTVGLILGLGLSFIFKLFAEIYFFVFALYVVLVTLSSLKLTLESQKEGLDNIKLVFFVISGIILTHIVYGIYFIKGLLAKRMPEE